MDRMYAGEGAMQDATQDAMTIGELCEAIASGRLSATVRDGHYEVTIGDVRRLGREEASVDGILQRLRSRLLDAGIVEDVVPGGEDVGQAI